jgi:geranylgeranyl pyrophosphate synthase
MIEEYEILIEEDNLQNYVESVKRLIDKVLREYSSSDIAFPHKPIFAVLLILSTEVCGGKLENVLNATASVELINKSSQIFEHDSVVAISLLNLAYSAIFETKNISTERQILAHKELVDCLNANKLPELKTITVMRLALRIGAVLAGADYMQLTAITRFADVLEQTETHVAMNQNNFVQQAKSIIRDEFGDSVQSHLLCDFANVYDSQLN